MVDFLLQRGLAKREICAPRITFVSSEVETPRRRARPIGVSTSLDANGEGWRHGSPRGHADRAVEADRLAVEIIVADHLHREARIFSGLAEPLGGGDRGFEALLHLRVHIADDAEELRVG